MLFLDFSEAEPFLSLLSPSVCFCVLFCCCINFKFTLSIAKSIIFHGPTPSLKKYILSICYEPGVVLGANTTVSERKTVPVLLELTVRHGSQLFKNMIP